MKLSVVIPAYNESGVIAVTLEKSLAYCQLYWSHDYEVIVVNDGSTDGTEDLVKRFSEVSLINLTVNSGKGAAVRTGLLAAKGDRILFLDADFSTSIEQLEFFRPYWDAYDIVIGSRAVSGAKVAVAQNILKRTLGRLGNSFIQLILLPGIQDTQCGFKLFKRSILPVAAELKRDDWSFDFELLFLASRQGLTIKEVPVVWVNNFDSKVTAWSYLTTLMSVFSVRLQYWFKQYHL